MKAVTEKSTEKSQYLSFRSCDELFAISLSRIREIIELGHCTRVPLMPDSVYGIINLRGNVVPVIDLGAMVTGTKVARVGRACIMVTEIAHHGRSYYTGILIDEVRAVIELSEIDIEPAPALGSGIPEGFLKGMVKTDERFLSVLDLDEVLNVDRIKESVLYLNRAREIGQGGNAVSY